MARISDTEDRESFDRFIHETDSPWCWWCGRDCMQAPKGWHAPWIIERAHIVNKPRLKDRRVCVLLCSRCHKLSHGEWFPDFDLPRPTLAHMLALKEIFDKEFVAMKLVRRCSVRRLPEPENPPVVVMREYTSRRRYPEPDYPICDEPLENE